MIRAKLILRNVTSKPLRSLIIILSLAAAAFAALYCISGINSAQNGLKDFFHSTYGNMDMFISSSSGKVTIDDKDLPADGTVVKQAFASFGMTSHSSKYFNYVSKTDISVIGLDTKLAYEAGLIDAAFPTKDGITITRNVAVQFEKKVGDTLSFYGSGGKEYELKILDIVEPKGLLTPSPFAIITTPELCNEINDDDEGTYSTIYIDVPDDRVSDTIAELAAKYPDHYILGTTSMDSEDAMGSMLNIYYLIFAVVFLMVCFIVVSMSKHIVNERMSVIGMLRSIGGSIRGTAMILLAESAFYGLIGGILGTLLFMPFRGSESMGFFAPSGIEGMEVTDGITPVSICLVILSVILIQCAFSAAAIIKAAKTPVRDIIFGTKETAYMPSKNIAIIGAVLLVLGIAAWIFFEDFTMTIAAAFFSAIGAVMLFPMVIKYASKALASVFGSMKMPVAKLAVKEISTTKSSVSSAQLILSAMSLTIAVLIIAASLISYMESPFFSSEVIITSPEQEGSQYDYIAGSIEGVQDVEKLYYKFLQYDTQAEVNGVERDLMVMGLNEGGFKYFNSIQNCPDALAEDEAGVDKALASKLGISVGDMITVRLKLENYLPSELKLKVKTLIDASNYNNLGNTLLINLDTYKSVYYDEPAYVLIKTAPDKVYSVMSTLKAMMVDSVSSIQSMEEFMIEYKSSMQGIMSIVYAVAVLGLALSLLGTSSNMLMGFEQSRRKYAVYYSSSMSKDKLKKLILLETFFTSGISLIAAVIFGMYFLQIINKALSMLYMTVPLIDPLMYALIFGICAFVILTIAAVKPVRMLSKMNIAEEIKTGAD